jgi:hypothetical protein
MFHIDDPAVRARIHTPDEFVVPTDYFDTLSQKLLQQAEPFEAVDDDFFAEQHQLLSGLALITAIDQRKESEFKIPQGYFETSRLQLENGISLTAPKVDRRVLQMKPIWWTSIAASMAVLIALYWMNKPKSEQLGFEALLAACPLDEQDLEWIADEEELASYYLSEIESMAQDTLLPDSLIKEYIPIDTLTAPQSSEGLPSRPPNKVDWDSLNEDEIWEYLMESGDAEELMN